MLEFAVPKVVVLRRRNSNFPKTLEKSCNIPWPAAALGVGANRYFKKTCVSRARNAYFVLRSWRVRAPRGASRQGCQRGVFKSRRFAYTESPLLLESVISLRYNTMLRRLGSPRSAPQSQQLPGRSCLAPAVPRQAWGHQPRRGPEAVPTTTRMASEKVCFSLRQQRFWSLG